jgi:putative DNA primase/helicase
LLTGGDKVSARRMRTDNFEFSPQFKLFLSGNKRPLLRSTSEAMRRRMHVIPFDVVLDDHEKDPRLLERLRDEWSGILQWAIDGCSDWQRRGLAPPSRAIAATTAYLEAQDTLGDWIDAALERWPDAKSTTDQLFRSYRQFITDRGEEAGNVKDFVAELEEKGFRKKREAKGWRWHGIGLVRQAE